MISLFTVVSDHATRVWGGGGWEWRGSFGQLLKQKYDRVRDEVGATMSLGKGKGIFTFDFYYKFIFTVNVYLLDEMRVIFQLQ